MASFQLPSGRSIEFTKDRPTWGDIMDAEDAERIAANAGRTAVFARSTLLITRLTELSESDVRELSQADGLELSMEIMRRAAPRSEGEQIPFSTPQPNTST